MSWKDVIFAIIFGALLAAFLYGFSFVIADIAEFLI